MCTCGCSVTVQEIEEGTDRPHKKMRSVAIWEAQEAMEFGVSIRDHGHTDFTA
jgi:hypothetical protein